MTTGREILQGPASPWPMVRGEGGPIVDLPATSTAQRYNVFHRNWWKRGPNGGRIPGAGRRTMIARNVTYDIARDIARDYNATHNPGFLSRKAELEES